MSHALLTCIAVIQVQAIVDHHHNVDAKVPTKVRFQEPGNQNVTDETKEKLMQEAETNNKEPEVTEEANEKEEAKENNDEETKVMESSPKPENKENKENTEKEEKECNDQEIKNQSPEVKKPTITP